MTDDAKWLQYRELLPDTAAKAIMGSDFESDKKYYMVSEPRGTFVTYEKGGKEVVVKLEEVGDDIQDMQIRENLFDTRVKMKLPPLYIFMIIFMIIIFILGIGAILYLGGYVQI